MDSKPADPKIITRLIVKKEKAIKVISKTHKDRSRVATFTFEQVKEMMSNPTHFENGKFWGTVDEIKFSLRRMYIIFEMGVTCKHCQIEGTKFCLEKNLLADYHLDLFSDDDTMLTIDHKNPRSLGGPDDISNYQCLCYPCNTKKGNRYSE